MLQYGECIRTMVGKLNFRSGNRNETNIETTFRKIMSQVTTLTIPQGSILSL